MSMIFFTYRAATQARMGVSILQKAGIPARMDRSPAGISEKGCGYGLWVRADRGAEAAAVLRRQGRPYTRSYRFTGDEVREVRL